MNKRFFTLMAAVMLAGAPLCNEAFALNYSSAVSTTAKLQNGAKFILSDGSGSYYKVADVVNANVTYATFDATTVVTEMVGSPAVLDLSKAAVFEVTNLQTNALGVTFQLKVNGKLVALTTGAAIITNTTPASQIYTTFHTSPRTTGYTLDIMDLFVVESASSIIRVANVTDLQSIKLSYDTDNLKEFNASSTTFSFPGTNVEGNVFNNVIPVASSLGGADVTYFVTGKAADIAAFKSAQNPTTAAKLSFVYVKNEKYGINTSVPGEGYKVVMINGADFSAPSGAADFRNAAFTGIEEADQLNKEGEIELSISPILGTSTTPVNVTIKSVKASTSDTKTYVTTVAASTPSRFATVSNPTLGANTYFAASEFLKAGEVSAYNIYFTTGEQMNGTEEYHKYLAKVSNGSAFNNNVLASKEVDLNSPAAQWIVTDFNGKYELTLANRLTNEALSLRLAATSTAGEYYIQSVTGVSGSPTNIANIIGTRGVSLAGKNIKLIPATLTKYDGTLNLSDEEMAEGITLSFSGANANIGEQTFYAASDGSTLQLIPSLEASEAVKFIVEKVKDPNNKDVAMNITPYAYTDVAGNVITGNLAKADTLIIPTYKLSVDIYGATHVVKNNMVLDRTAGNASGYIINKTMSGAYTISYNPAVTATTYADHNNAAQTAIGVNNVTSGTILNAQFDNRAGYFTPAVAGFAYLGINANDNTDYTTLPAVSRHATLENPLGAVSMQVNKNGILEGILGAEPMTFWLDTADSDQNTPHFYISKGVHNADGELAEMRNFLVYAPDSTSYWDEASAMTLPNPAYILEGTWGDTKAIFRPAALVGVDTLSAEIDGTMKTIVKKATAAGEIAALKNFQFGICLNDEDVEGEYVIYSKEDPLMYLYSHNGKLGFGWRNQALVVTLGEGDATANEAVEAESGVEVIAGQGVVTVQGAAGKVITVSNILGQTIANQVAASDNVTIAAPAGVVVVTVDGEVVKTVVK